MATSRTRHRDDGFTLIELLVVVIIIGILAAIAIPVFLSQREKARSASVKSDLRNAATAQVTYLDGADVYAPDVSSLYAIDAFRRSPGVEFTEVKAQAGERFCMVARHTQDAGGYWFYDSATPAPVATTDPAHCTSLGVSWT